jgi:hypothetical protein
MPEVELLTVEDARERRAQVLASIGGDEEALRRRGARYELEADELAALTELEELDYLLNR